MKYPVDIELLKRFVQNACTPEELARVREFIRQPEYKEALSEMLDEQWERFEPSAEPLEAEMRDWKSEFEHRREVLERPTRTNRIWLLRWIGYAAASVLVFASILLYQGKKEKEVVNSLAKVQEIVTPLGQRASVTLPDSSVVTLGPGSRLKYAENFAVNTREITLEGEAFFEVTKDPAKPFIIHTGIVQTRVVGTSFKIDALKGSRVTVSVSTGKVRVSSVQQGTEQMLALLTPGQGVDYDTVSKKIELRSFRAADVTEWKTGLLSFNGSSLNEALISLERWYNVDISPVRAGKGKKRIKLIVDGKKPISAALETITQLTGMKYRIVGKQIQIY